MLIDPTTRANARHRIARVAPIKTQAANAPTARRLCKPTYGARQGGLGHGRPYGLGEPVIDFEGPGERRTEELLPDGCATPAPTHTTLPVRVRLPTHR